MKLSIPVLLGLLLFIYSCKTTEPGKAVQQNSLSQSNISAFGNYHGSYTKLFDLIHTKLELKLNWDNKELYGRAYIQLKPHYYPSDDLLLNARGMEIHSVELEEDGIEMPTSFHYENNLLKIKLNKLYTRNDTVEVMISYTSRPELLPEGGSAAIRKDKGLYFINADGKDPYLPKQLWTQGETESNSVWFPTIEDPGQRMTQEIYFTVDSTFKTLSNGLNLSTVSNPDGKRTDYWKQSYPLAPYLTMIAVGDFAVVKDEWRGKEVSYYLDKDYEKYAKMIFGTTPEMMDFFSEKLDLDYPWEKYSQVVVHNFVSGAMENNTAVVHGTNMLQDPREFKDSNYEDIISHELFHHWFGNLVTSESWANVTLNEGFASYGEYLWREYKYGRDNADAFGQEDEAIYLRASKKTDAPLIRFFYDEREDMYDAVSYQKGARVLHLLRKTIGDEAFFTAIRNYLKEHKFSTAEFNQLRIEFEKVTGQDLNWFFNQWYLKAGKPSLEISTNWNSQNNELTLSLKQIQDMKKNPVYRLPMEVDFYFEDKTTRKNIILDSLEQEFKFSFEREPKLINVDAEKSLLLEKKVEHKNTAAWIFQYRQAPLYLDRYEAVNALAKNYRIQSPEAEIIFQALEDKNPTIRLLALRNVKEMALNAPEKVKPTLINLAQNDSNSFVRASAYEALGEYYSFKELSPIFTQAIPDYSYNVEASVFDIISEKDYALALTLSDTLESDSSSIVLGTLASFYSEHPDLDKLEFYRRALFKTSSWSQYRIVNFYTTWIRGQKESVIREGSEDLLSLGLITNSRHIRNNCAASLVRIQNELDERIKSLKKSQTQKIFDKVDGQSVSRDEVDLLQLESLSKDIEVKIKQIEKKH